MAKFLIAFTAVIGLALCYSDDRPWLIFSTRNIIMGMYTDGMSAPKPLLAVANSISIDYDFKNKMLYWSDVSLDAILRAPIKDDYTLGNPEKILDEHIQNVDGISVDWVHGNIYWTDNKLKEIGVAMLNGSMRTTLVKTDLDEPRGIAVDPNDGLLFCSDWGKQPKIERMSLDGDPTFRKTIVSDQIQWPNGVALDLHAKRVYWTDAKFEWISSIQYDGTGRRVVHEKSLKIDHPFSIAIYEDNVFWSDWKSYSVNLANKMTGEDLKTIYNGPNTPYGVTVYHSLVQIQGSKRCVHQNGNSSQLCLPRPLKIYRSNEVTQELGHVKETVVLAVNGSVLTSGLTEATYNDGLNELAVPSSLQGLTVTALLSSLRVSWSSPNPESKTLVGGYIVGWGKGIPDEYQRFVNANTHNYTIDNLDPSSEYVITVRAFNSYGIGQPIYKTATTSAEAYDFTQNVRCNFKVYRDTSVIYNGLVSSSNTYTMEECRRVCEDSSSGFEECVAFRYGRTAGGECSLYFDRNGIRKMVPQSGFDYYDKTCGQYTTTQIMPLMPPVAVKCIVLSPSSVLLTWSDTSLGTNQVVQDNRFYTVRYRATSNAGEYRFLNSSEPNAHIDSLEPNTRYEFEVKVQKGDRTSTWSVNAVNTTMEAVPGSAPRNLTLIPKVNDPSAVTVIWLPPSKPNGQITGYLVYYTTDATHDVRDWVYQGVLGEELTTTIKHLTPNTTYYIKIQARNRKGYGPGSQTYVYKSPKNYLTPNVDCNYTEYRDTTVKYNGMMSSSNTYTMEECRRECDDSGFEECVAFLYGRTSGGECSLYYDRNGIQEMVSRSGFDFYVKTCGQSSGDPAVKMPSVVPRGVEVTSASVAQFTCSANQFTCTNGKCIPKTWTCDGDRDCEDNSDETNCAQLTCNADQFTCTNGKCIPKRWICDGERDCEDNSDETNCEPLTCGPNMFRCDNDSKCKDNSWKCDGDFDCIDRSDEMNCTTANVTHRCRGTEWECKSGEQCIHGSWKCDGEADCPDGSDEENCTFTCKPDQFQCAGKSCIHASLRCDGSLDCTDGSDETNCTVHPIACKAEEFDCFNNGSSCIAVSSVCNGSMECPNGADENMNICGNNPCNMNNGGCVHTCIPLPNQKHRCECLPGFRLVGNSSCEDIDECLEDKHVCSQICSNTNGSYICSCVSGYEMKRQSGHQYCKVIGERPSLIFANRHDIRELKLDSMQVARMVEGLRSAISVDYDFKNKMMYWSDSSTLRRAPISYNITPEMQETIVSDDIKVPDGIAVDWIYGNIYWTDTGVNRIEVSKQDGTMRKTLIDSDIDEPRAIAVDPNEGWLFFSDWGFHPKIERVAMDGDASTREIIVKDDILWPNGLTIDYLEKRVYWVDAKVHKVSSVDYDGKRLRNILQNDNQVQSPFAIAVFEDDIFWTDWASNSIKTINKISGKDYRQLATGISSPMDIHVYHEKVQISGMNHCGQYNGQCSHLCLPIPTVNAKGKRYSCACPNGFDLGGDGFKCIQVGVSGSVLEPQIS